MALETLETLGNIQGPRHCCVSTGHPQSCWAQNCSPHWPQVLMSATYAVCLCPSRPQQRSIVTVAVAISTTASKDSIVIVIRSFLSFVGGCQRSCYQHPSPWRRCRLKGRVPEGISSTNATNVRRRKRGRAAFCDRTCHGVFVRLRNKNP